MDFSATLINQTAVKFLIRDSAQILARDIAAYQFLGETFETSIVGDPTREQLLARLYGAVESATAPKPTARRLDAPLLYFDPIYTLFGPLDARDYVFVLDVTTLTNPEWHNPRVSKLYEQAFQRVLQSECHTIHISSNTLFTMRAVLGSEGPRPSVLHLYIRRLRSDSSASCPHNFDLGKYILFVGSLEERKNISGLICAFEMSQLARQGYRLVIAGGDGHGADRIRAVAFDTPGVFLLGYVSDADLHHLYEHATAFVYPSFLEGFGVPLLEAMAYGLPCVASMTGACPEVGGSDVIYVDPFDAQAISAAMLSLLSLEFEERSAIGIRLRDRAEQIFCFSNYEAGLKTILAGVL